MEQKMQRKQSIKSIPGFKDPMGATSHPNGKTQETDQMPISGKPDIERYIGNHFSTPGGKIILNVLKQQYYDRISYVKGDTHETAKREGQREVVAYFINCVAYATVQNKKEEVS